jgi:hypothetical protein
LRTLADSDAARLELQSEHLELLAGIVAATVANYGFAPPKKALAPADFMPSQQKARRQQKHETAAGNRELIAQNIRCFLKAQLTARQ